MREEVKKRLDEELNKRARRKWYIGASVLLAGCILMLGIVPVTSSNLFGVLDTASARQLEEGSQPFFMI